MQARLFRFEILRSLAPATFEARDPASGTVVQIYEWTPTPADRDAAKLRLSQLSDRLHAEVFTADASLYLAAGSAALGREDLEVLRAHNLFTGVTVAPESISPQPLPAAPPPQAVPVQVPLRPQAAADTTRPRAGRMVLGTLVSAAALAAAYAVGAAGQRSPNCPAPIVDNRPAEALSEQAAQNRQLQGQLTEERQAAAVNAQALAASSSVNLLRVKNDCTGPVRVAVLYTGFNRTRIAQGWVTVAAGETSVVAASPAHDFSVFATTVAGEQTWGSDTSAPMDTVPGDFLYPVGTGLDSPDKTSHGTFSVHVNAPTDVSALDCRIP